MKYFIPNVYRYFGGYILIEGKRKDKSAAKAFHLITETKSQNISNLGMNITNLPINITVRLVSHRTDNILMIKFRKQQFPESFVAYIISGCANKMPARPALLKV